MAPTNAQKYPPDPGGNFASDVHRRVAAAIPNQDQQDESATIGRDAANHKIKAAAKTLPAIRYYVERDDDTPTLTEAKLKSIIEDLISDGDVSELKDGFKLTKQGEEVASGPNAARGGRDYYEVYDPEVVKATVEAEAAVAKAAEEASDNE